MTSGGLKDFRSSARRLLQIASKHSFFYISSKSASILPESANFTLTLVFLSWYPEGLSYVKPSGSLRVKLMKLLLIVGFMTSPEPWVIVNFASIIFLPSWLVNTIGSYFSDHNHFLSYSLEWVSTYSWAPAAWDIPKEKTLAVQAPAVSYYSNVSHVSVLHSYFNSEVFLGNSTVWNSSPRSSVSEISSSIYPYIFLISSNLLQFLESS